MCVCSSWQNGLLETPIVGNYSSTVLSTLPAVYVSVYVRFCLINSVTAVEDEVMTFYRCVVKIKIKAEFKDGEGPPIQVLQKVPENVRQR